MQTTSNPPNLLLLRAIVAAVGERTSPPWWRTTLLTDVGLRISARVFPRTALEAAVKSVAMVAQRDHDERVGADRFHLFRLPSQTERELWASLSQDHTRSEIGVLLNGDRQGLLDRLEVIAGEQRVEATDGPIRIGSVSDIRKPEFISRCAAHYLASVAYGTRRFPYFEAPEAGR